MNTLSTLKVFRSLEKIWLHYSHSIPWIKNAYRSDKRERFCLKTFFFFNSLSSETRRENPGVLGAVPDLYFVESTECWQPQTGGSVTVSNMCTILDDTHLSLLTGGYFPMFDSKDNRLSYLKISIAEFLERIDHGHILLIQLLLVS